MTFIVIEKPIEANNVDECIESLDNCKFITYTNILLIPT